MFGARLKYYIVGLLGLDVLDYNDYKLHTHIFEALGCNVGASTYGVV